MIIPEDQNLLLGTKLDTTGLEDLLVRFRGKITVKDDVSTRFLPFGPLGNILTPKLRRSTTGEMMLSMFVRT